MKLKKDDVSLYLKQSFVEYSIKNIILILLMVISFEIVYKLYVEHSVFSNIVILASLLFIIISSIAYVIKKDLKSQLIFTTTSGIVVTMITLFLSYKFADMIKLSNVIVIIFSIIFIGILILSIYSHLKRVQQRLALTSSKFVLIKKLILTISLIIFVFFLFRLVTNTLSYIQLYSFILLIGYCFAAIMGNISMSGVIKLVLIHMYFSNDSIIK